jgi:putative permease
MFHVVNVWFQRYFSHPQAVLLAVLLILSFAVLYTMGEMLTPVLAAVVIAYLLEGTVKGFELHMPRIAAVSIVFIFFMALLIFTLVVLLPLLSFQLSQILQEVPHWMGYGQRVLMQLPERYPEFISAEQIQGINTAVRQGVREFGQSFLSYSLSSIPALITFLVYLILVPLLIFFFLKDKLVLLSWFASFLPRERTIAAHLWTEMDFQIGNYIRGKVYEIFIVGVATYVAFVALGLNYAPLLAALVGLSVVVPYIGAAVVTVPVAIVAYFQWGLSSDFYWLISIYLIIQALDGNVLVPLLFSEAVNLHPIAIIVAVLVFGGLWGFWGVFFAIPLATLVKALMAAWPRTPNVDDDTENIATEGETE